MGSILLFASTALQQLRWRFVTPFDHSVYADVMRSEPMRIGMDLAFYIGIAAFAISYVWFALTHKSI